MAIICPSCQASYNISAAALGSGRTVRCARCRNQWFATADAEDAAPADALEPIHGLDDAIGIDAIDTSDPHLLAEALDARPIPARRAKPSRPWFGRKVARPGDQQQRKRLFKLRPAALVAALGVVVIGGLVGGRIEVVRAAPSLASLYARVGMPVNVRGLTIGELRSVERIEEGVPVLLVSGEIRNVSGDAIEAPRLRLAITGDQDRELYAWTTVASRAKLAVGESAPFRARLASPPAEGRGLTARFVAQKDLAARSPR